MKRSIVLAAWLFAACGSEEERPATLEYITEAILVPACATANCHSSFAESEGLSYASLEEARDALSGQVEFGEDGFPPTAADTLLMQVLLSPGGDGAPKQMPRDAPLANADIDLIFDWVQAGAPGVAE